MYYYTRFLLALTFLLLYSEHVFFLAGYAPLNDLRLALEAGLESRCYGGSGGLAGEYGAILHDKEWFYMSIQMFSLQPHC
jgi:hypothetical protein